MRGTFEVQVTSRRPRITVSADGTGVVSHAGSRLLADVADRTTLTGELSEVLAGLRMSRARHDPGRVLVDMAVAVADGATTISDVAVLADQSQLFGSVASDSTCWRLLDQLGARGSACASMALARAAARELVWAQRAETTGAAFPPARAGGRVVPGLVADLDASRLRRGNAGANTAADHIVVLDEALAQIPDAHRHGSPVLIRADTAGCTKQFLTHVRELREQLIDTGFSVGWVITERERTAIVTIRRIRWADAIDADGGDRDGAGLAEITGVLPATALADYPAGTRVIVRRERPQPGAQLDAFEERDGWRYTTFATDTPTGQLAHLDARHPARTPGSKTASAVPKTPVWATSRRARSRSTPPG